MKHHSHPRSSKTTVGSAAVVTALTLAIVPASMADTTWQGTTATWSTVGNWSTGASPASPATGAIYPGNATIQNIDLAGGTGRVEIGGVFDFFAGGSGYTFSGTAGSVAGFFIRAGGTANGLLNNDDNTQTFNVPIKLFSNTGAAGAAAAQTFNAAGGNLVFNGNNNAPVSPWTINLNGASALTMTAAAGKTISVGTTGPGQIVNTNVGTFSGLIKKGAGKLYLGGTAANTYVGTNVIQQGTITAGKANALGSGNALKVSGDSTLETGGLNQNIGTLDLQANLTLDLGNGTSNVKFADSTPFDWGTFFVTILNYTPGVDTVAFGVDGSGLTQDQLDHIIFADQGNLTAQIDGNGFLAPVPVPEPSTFALGMFGGLGMLFMFRRIRSKN